MAKEKIPVDRRLCITIEEAAEYSLLGEQRLRKIIEEDITLEWVLHVGSWIRIKRPQFEKWVLSQNHL